MTNVRTIDHPDHPVDVWFDPCPDSDAVAVHLRLWGRDQEPVYVPVEVAREVAEAILATIPN